MKDPQAKLKTIVVCTLPPNFRRKLHESGFKELTRDEVLRLTRFLVGFKVQDPGAKISEMANILHISHELLYDDKDPSTVPTIERIQII